MVHDSTHQVETPLSITGSDSRRFQAVGVNTQLQVHVDWLQGTCRLMNDDFVHELVAVVMRMLGDTPVWEPNQGSYVGKQWQHRGHSIKGVRWWWDSPGQSQHSHVMLSIPGSVCSGVDVRVIWELSKFLDEVFKFKVTRLDIALDDYRKRLSFDQLMAATQVGNFARVKKITPIANYHRNGELKGWGFDVGSKQSDCYMVIYEKEVESKGRIKSIRCEGRFKDEVGHELWKEWLAIPAEQFEGVSPTFLAAKVIGIVEFVERHEGVKNICRMRRLPWWEGFVNAVGGRLGHSIKKPDSTLDRARQWWKRQVAPTLAVLRKVLGIHGYRRLHDEYLAEAEAKFSAGHEAKIMLWSEQQSDVSRRSHGAAEIIDEDGQKWAWVWYQSKMVNEWRIARLYDVLGDAARVRFSGESPREITKGFIHLGAKKPTWQPRMLNAVMQQGSS
jgi:hypothetical protein